MKAIIFDLDGTLFAKPHIARHLVLANLFHLSMLKAERSCRGELKGCYWGEGADANSHLFDMMAERLHCTPEKVAQWYWDKYMPSMIKVIRRHYGKASWVPSLMQECRRRQVKMAVLSDYPCVREKLSAIGLDASSFDMVADAPSSGGFKPCAEVFLSMARRMEVAPADILVVGDRDDTDGEGARRAGMMFRLVDNSGEYDVGNDILPYLLPEEVVFDLFDLMV